MSVKVVCIGGALVDELLYLPGEALLRTTNTGITVTKSAGGVSRNIAHQLAVLGIPVELISVFGNDADGEWLKAVCTRAGIGVMASLTAPVNSGKYTGIINHDGSLYTAFLTNASEELITPDYLEQHRSLLNTAAFLLADTNLTPATISWLIDFSNTTAVPLVIEPVSVPPAKKLAAINLSGVYLITPNEDELPAMCSEAAHNTAAQVKELLERGVQNIWLHKGSEGSVWYNKEGTVKLAAPVINLVDCTGAGDGSLAGFILGKLVGKPELECLQLAHTLAAEILQVNGAIATHIDQQQLFQLVKKYY